MFCQPGDFFKRKSKLTRKVTKAYHLKLNP